MVQSRWASAVFRAAMSQTRFKQIKSALRFDDTLRRNREDPLAPIRDVFNQINASLGRNIKPSENLLMNNWWSITEECDFPDTSAVTRQARHKNFLAIRSQFRILLVYIGHGTVSEIELNASGSVPEAIVMNLVHSYLNKGYNLVGDNWFTSLHLSRRLLENDTT